MSKVKDAEQERPAPQRLLDLGHGLAIWQVHVDDLREQELNARAQPPPMFERLSSTIGRDQRLESLPFCAAVDDAIELVSGHHRTRAARAAGVQLIHVVVDETDLTRDQIAAKQLAHNAIEGSDETQLIVRIYQQIRDVDARLESFVQSMGDIELRPEPVSLPRLDLTVDYRTVLITFLPNQADLFDRAVGQILEQVDLDRDQLYLADRALYERWQATMSRLKKEYDARGLSTVIARMLDAAAEVLGIEGRSPEDIDPAAYVPLTELLGTAVVPPALAQVVAIVTEHAVAQKTVTRRTRIDVLDAAMREYAHTNGITLPDD